MNTWISVDGSHARRFMPDLEPKSFPVFDRKPNETRAMTNERWSREHKALSAAQRLYVEQATAKAFDDIVSAPEASVLIENTKYRLVIALQKVFMPLLADLRVTNPQWNIIHNGSCFEAHITYSLTGGASHYSINITNLSPSEYATLVK